MHAGEDAHVENVDGERGQEEVEETDVALADALASPIPVNKRKIYMRFGLLVDRFSL